MFLPTTQDLTILLILIQTLKHGQADKKRAFLTKRPLRISGQKISVNKRIHGATVDATAALSTLIGDPIDITRLDNCADRTGIDTGPATDTLVCNFQSHN